MNYFVVETSDPHFALFWPKGDTIRIIYDINFNGNRVEFGFIQNKIFRKPKFIMCDYVPASILKSIGVTNEN